jgi:hypothetical protein
MLNVACRAVHQLDKKETVTMTTVERAKRLRAYMTFRAAYEKQEHDLRLEDYRHLIERGIDYFSGVVVGQNGLLRDERQPLLFAQWQKVTSDQNPPDEFEAIQVIREEHTDADDEDDRSKFAWAIFINLARALDDMSRNTDAGFTFREAISLVEAIVSNDCQHQPTEENRYLDRFSCEYQPLVYESFIAAVFSLLMSDIDPTSLAKVLEDLETDELDAPAAE